MNHKSNGSPFTLEDIGLFAKECHRLCQQGMESEPLRDLFFHQGQ